MWMAWPSWVPVVEPCVVADTGAADLYLCTIPLAGGLSNTVSFRVSEPRPAALVDAMPPPFRFQRAGPTVIQQQEAKRIWLKYGGLGASAAVLALLFDERELPAEQ